MLDDPWRSISQRSEGRQAGRGCTPVAWTLSKRWCSVGITNHLGIELKDTEERTLTPWSAQSVSPQGHSKGKLAIYGNSRSRKTF